MKTPQILTMRALIKKHDVTVTEEKDDTTTPDDARTDTKYDNDNNTKETGETSDVTNEK